MQLPTGKFMYTLHGAKSGPDAEALSQPGVSAL
jgi:hypothetical protein